MTLMTVFEVNKSHGCIFRVSNSKATELKQLGSTEHLGGGRGVAEAWLGSSPLRMCSLLCPVSPSPCQGWSVSPELKQTSCCWWTDRGASAGQILEL